MDIQLKSLCELLVSFHGSFDGDFDSNDSLVSDKITIVTAKAWQLPNMIMNEQADSSKNLLIIEQLSKNLEEILFNSIEVYFYQKYNIAFFRFLRKSVIF